MNAGTNSLLSGSEVDLNPDGGSNGDTGSLNNQREVDRNLDLKQEKEDGREVSPSKTLPDTSDPMENKIDVHRTQSDGHLVMKNLSVTFILQASLERRLGDYKSNYKLRETSDPLLKLVLAFFCGNFSSQAADSKTRAELEEIALTEAHVARLKQKVAEIVQTESCQ
ncbi:unnamed protein product [Eruca vesicaria subsp. sativa]|uniref:Uncharacterized protein n=1 Tax=Eruca vesicaria subsp. sativa TaxID=29727 RepID=A0ABC8K405_ERUVS|nr:unnamed protein product [Eruca vesicaria subsp. sativa]